MTRIGLLNIQYVDNYGANLISYSMERELGEMGFSEEEVRTIDFRPDGKTVRREKASWGYNLALSGTAAAIRHTYRKLRKAIRRWIRSTALFKQARKLLGRGEIQPDPPPADAEDRKMRAVNFDAFHRRFLHLTDRRTSADMAEPDFDVVIVGSDVVWKPQRLLTREESRAYFLTDAAGCKKIAYAASIGTADEAILKRLRERYARAIGAFDHISLREKTTREYVQGLLPQRDVMNCIDPVFLRTKDEYLELMGEKDTRDQDYVYVYLMGENPKAYQYAAQLAAERGLEIVYYTNYPRLVTQGISSISDGPIQFLRRVCHARYVVTDTFHGTALSIILGKQFITFTRGNMSIRLEDLLSRLRLTDRFVEVTDDLSIIDREIPYDAVHAEIAEWAEISRVWLKNAVNVCVGAGGSESTASAQ